MKYKNKKSLLKKYSEKISSQKYYYDILRRSGSVEVGFYQSEIYKKLKKQKKAAIYRWDNRDAIRASQKKRRDRLKQIVNSDDATKYRSIYSGAAIDAFKGRLSQNDMSALSAIRHGNFLGRIIVHVGGDEIENRLYTTIPGLFRELARWIRTLFSKENYSIFETEVTKKAHFDPETKTLYYTVEINKQNSEEDE